MSVRQVTPDQIGWQHLAGKERHWRTAVGSIFIFPPNQPEVLMVRDDKPCVAGHVVSALTSPTE